MDKFSKVFEASMEDSMDRLEEGKFSDFISKAKNKAAEKKRRAGEDIGVAANRAKAAMSEVGGKIKEKADKVGKKAKEIGQDTAQAARAVGEAPGEYASKRRMNWDKTAAAKEALTNLGKKAPTRGKIALGVGGGLLAGGGAAGAYALKRRGKKKVAESALEEVKARIEARRLEEAGTLYAKMGDIGKRVLGFGKKVGQQTKNVGADLGYFKRTAGARYGIGAAETGSKWGGAYQAAKETGKGLVGTARFNPWGAGVVGGGTLGAGGLAAWGLKKPKNKQQ